MFEIARKKYVRNMSTKKYARKKYVRNMSTKNMPAKNMFEICLHKCLYTPALSCIMCYVYYLIGIFFTVLYRKVVFNLEFGLVGGG